MLLASPGIRSIFPGGGYVPQHTPYVMYEAWLNMATFCRANSRKVGIERRHRKCTNVKKKRMWPKRIFRQQPKNCMQYNFYVSHNFYLLGVHFGGREIEKLVFWHATLGMLTAKRVVHEEAQKLSQYKLLAELKPGACLLFFRPAKLASKGIICSCLFYPPLPPNKLYPSANASFTHKFEQHFIVYMMLTVQINVIFKIVRGLFQASAFLDYT